MNDLMTLQKEFQEYLLNSENEIHQRVTHTEKVSAETRLAIYANAYHIRLHDALAESYSVLQTYIGEENFEALAKAYINQHPSPYRSIRWFGDKLANFIREQAEYQNYQIFAELATLEWILTLTFDAANSANITVDEIGKIPPQAWSDMQLTLPASFHHEKFSWNSVNIWQAISDKKDPPAPVKSQSAVDWIFWRQELSNHFCSIPEDEAWALLAIREGLTFGEICEGLCRWVDEENAPLHAATFLRGWISSGLIVEIKYE